ncbi:MAG: hypothetical protein WDZ90_02270 [Candidatus Paceibacterota bacterium]
MKYFFFIFLLFSFAFASPLFAETLENVGFAPSNIWYSKEPFFAGDDVRIYTVLYNSSDKDIKGEIVFYDNGAEIDRSTFSIAQGRVQDVWINWRALEGVHEVTAQLESTRATLPDGSEVEVSLAQNTTGKSERVIEPDTDKDGIPNSADTDDDGDGVTDEAEIVAGTDPLKANTDGSIKNKEDSLLANLPSTDSLKNTAQSVKEDALPAVSGVVGSAYKKSEEIRHTLKDFAENKVAELSQEKESSNKEGLAAASQAAVLGGTYSLLYMARYQLLFYGVLVVLLFLATRWMWRRARGDRF